jgi:hypothetical protein
MQIPISFNSKFVGPPPATPEFDLYRFLLSPDSNGYAQGVDLDVQFQIYAHSALGGYSATYAESGLYGITQAQGDLDYIEYVYDPLSSMTGSQSFSLQAQSSEMDNDSNTGYGQMCNMGIDVITDLTDYTGYEIPGVGYNIGDSIEYRVWQTWDDGTYFSDGAAAIDITISGSMTAEIELILQNNSGFQSPQVYIERRVNGGDWYYQIYWNGEVVDDSSGGWTLGIISPKPPVPFTVNVHMFGNALAVSSQGWRVQKYDNNLLTTEKNDIANTLGDGFVIDGTGWTSGAASFHTPSKFLIRPSWNSSVGASTYHVLGYANEDEIGIRNFDEFIDTSSTEIDDNNTGWTPV